MPRSTAAVRAPAPASAGAAGRRADVFNVSCPSRSVLELVAGKWALLIVDALAAGPQRTAGLRRRIGGISEKMLIQTLRRLQRSGFIARPTAHASPTGPHAGRRVRPIHVASARHRHSPTSRMEER